MHRIFQIVPQQQQQNVRSFISGLFVRQLTGKFSFREFYNKCVSTLVAGWKTERKFTFSGCEFNNKLYPVCSESRENVWDCMHYFRDFRMFWWGFYRDFITEYREKCVRSTDDNTIDDSILFIEILECILNIALFTVIWYHLKWINKSDK